MKNWTKEYFSCPCNRSYVSHPNLMLWLSVAGSGRANTRWPWASTTTWMCTVHTTRALSLTVAWSATSFSWWTMMVTLPVSTAWGASSGGSVTGPRVPMDPCASLRSSSSSPPSHLVLSFGLGMSTITYVSVCTFQKWLVVNFWNEKSKSTQCCSGSQPFWLSIVRQQYSKP